MKAQKHIHDSLVEACRLGSSKAQSQIYDLYARAMFQVVWRIVGNSHDAEDVMQEAFLKAFRKIDDYHHEATFGAWLKRIMINQSLDYLRQKKIDFMPLDEKMPVADPTDAFDEEAIAAGMQRIKQAVQLLPYGYRLIFSLVAFEGFDYDEVSDILHIQASAVRSQYARAKARLIDLLREN